MFRLSSVILGVLSFSFPLIFFVYRNKLLDVIWAALGCVALLVSTFDLLTNYPDLCNRHAVLEQRWSTLRNEWDQLFLDRDKLDPQELRARYDRLMAEERAIESAEQPGEAGPELLDAWKKEAQVRNVSL